MSTRISAGVDVISATSKERMTSNITFVGTTSINCNYVLFLVLSHFTERFKQNDNVINTSAITAVTKSSMKP